MATHKNTEGTLLTQGMENAETAVNEVDALLDAAVVLLVIGEHWNPPVSPSNGDLWLIAGSPRGVWSSNVGDLALYNTGWKFFTPTEGFSIYRLDLSKRFEHDGTSFINVAGANGTNVARVTDNSGGTPGGTVEPVVDNFEQTDNNQINSNFSTLATQFSLLIEELIKLHILSPKTELKKVVDETIQIAETAVADTDVI